jgi:hypothetical protein
LHVFLFPFHPHAWFFFHILALTMSSVNKIWFLTKPLFSLDHGWVTFSFTWAALAVRTFIEDRRKDNFLESERKCFFNLRSTAGIDMKTDNGWISP